MNMLSGHWRFGGWTYRSLAIIDREIDDELDFHIECRTHDLIATGLSPQQAAAEANRQFGVREKFRRECQTIDYGHNLWMVIGVCGVFLTMMTVIGWLGTRLNSVSQQNRLMEAQLAALQPPKVEKHALTGKIVDTKGMPVADAKVLLIYKSWPRGGYQQQPFDRTTDAQGAFSFAEGNQLQGREAFLVTVVKDGFAFQSRYVIKENGKKVGPFQFRLAPAVNKVFVLQESGRPVADATVALSTRKEAKSDEHLIYAASAPAVSFRTDKDGKVALNYFAVADTAKLSVMTSAGLTEVEVTIDGNPEQIVDIKKKNSPPETSLPWTPPPTTVEASQVEWVRTNAIPIRLAVAGKVEGDDFSDLQPLKKLIGDSRIVQLGEQSHGDGACFQAKVRLIEFLHREMDFDVLAFESGLYDCYRANAAFGEEMKPIQAAQQGVFGIWSGSSELVPLWNYVAAAVKTPRPLELAGFDCQFTGEASKKLANDLKAIADKYRVPGVSGTTNRAWREFFLQLRRIASGEKFAGSQEKWMASLDGLMVAIENAKPTDDVGEQELIFWRQQLRSLKAYVSYAVFDSAKPGAAVDYEQINARDIQMAENLVWLANQRYAGKKIIVWAASFHILHDAASIEVPDNSVNYSTTITMGHRVHQKLGKDVFTIGFTAADGQAGVWFRPSFPIHRAPGGTLEDICAKANLETAIVPLRNLPAEAAWLTEKIFARPLGYGWMKARWGDHFDAMVFQRTMTPATAIR